MSKFSIILPTYNRATTLGRAINSILTQTFEDWQLIVIDDHSLDNTDEIMAFYSQDDRIEYLKQEEHLERVKAINRGFTHATGEWQCWLDSDDAYVPTYLEYINSAIEKYGDFDVCNFGAVVIHDDYHVTFRETFRPERLEEGHVPFRSGGIGAGSFVYKSKLIDEVGIFPAVNDPYQFAVEAKKEMPEILDFFGDGELGNPWGQDWYLFYKLTRKHWSRPLDTALYIQYGKYEKNWP